MFKSVITCLCSILFFHYAVVAWGISNNTLNRGCPLTPQIWGLEIPGITEKNNDLRYQTGHPDVVPGKQIMIQGYVMDEYCIPVTNASISIWQILSMGEKDIKYLTGSTSTDSVGKFTFFSVMPISHKNLAPKISLNIKHPDLPSFETKIFFPEFNNSEDSEFTSLDPDKRHLLICSRTKKGDKRKNYTVYDFDIAIEGKLKYKEF